MYVHIHIICRVHPLFIREIAVDVGWVCVRAGAVQVQRGTLRLPRRPKVRGIRRMRLRELEQWLSQVQAFEEPKVELEQYPTSAHIASHMLFTMEQE